jgi:hypothetical protein
MPYKDPEIARAKGIERGRRWRANNPDRVGVMADLKRNKKRQEQYAADPVTLRTLATLLEYHNGR